MKNHANNNIAGILAVGAMMALPASALAAEPGFSFVELNYIDVDVDYAESLSIDGDSVSLSTDAGTGFQLAGAFEFGERWHVYGEYSQAGQDLSLAALIGGEAMAASGSFDIVRYRLGIGYAFGLTDAMQAYGRATLDSIEINDFELDGEDLGDTDDDGFGAELGVVWAAMPNLHVQALTRYSSVGKLESDGNDEFGSDLVFGLSGRWHFTDAFALQAGYETGDISTLHAGVRMAF